MKNLILVCIFVFMSIPVFSQGWSWAFQTRNLENVKTVIADNDEIFLAANFKDSCTINNASIQSDSAGNVLIAKISSGGNLLWARLFSGTELEYINIEIENNDLVIAIQFYRSLTGPINASAESAFLIARFASNGTLLNHTVDGNTRYLSYTHMALLNNGDVLISGTAYDSISLDGTLTTLDHYGEGFIAKYDQNYHLKMLKRLLSDQTGAYQSLGIYTDAERNFYLNGGGGDSLTVLNDTILSFAFPFSNLVQFDSNGTVKANHTTCTYFPHLTHFAAYNNGAYSIELWEDGSCNHCNTGLNIRRTASNGTDDWVYNYPGSNVYSSPSFYMMPGGLATTTNEIYFTAGYGGTLTLGTFTLNSRCMLLVKMNHNGNYLNIDSLPSNVLADELSNVSNHGFIASGYYGGAPVIAGAQMDSAPQYYTSTYKFGFVAKYSDTLASGISEKNASGISFILYPNPSDGRFKIESKGSDIIDQIEVRDATGKSVLSKNICSQNCYLDLSSFNDGFYVVGIRSGSLTDYKKLILNRK